MRHHLLSVRLGAWSFDSGHPLLCLEWGGVRLGLIGCVFVVDCNQ